MAEVNEYLHFCGPQRRDKALHTLIGIIRGMSADGGINEDERRELRDWVTMHGSLVKKCSGFAAIAEAVERAVADGIVTQEEQQDLIALCERLESNSEYFGATTNAIQELQGRLHGVIADGRLTVEEADGLLDWLDQFEGLRKVWPVTEVEALLVDALKDGHITPAEQEELIAFFGHFASLSTDSPVRKRLALTAKDMTVRGICAVDPIITFSEHSFCFTGLSRRASRRECHEAVRSRGGRCTEYVSGELSYLVVCAEGNPAWAYACYGRKVEEAVRRRSERGESICIVHESDFWDALN